MMFAILGAWQPSGKLTETAYSLTGANCPIHFKGSRKELVTNIPLWWDNLRKHRLELVLAVYHVSAKRPYESSHIVVLSMDEDPELVSFAGYLLRKQLDRFHEVVCKGA